MNVLVVPFSPLESIQQSWKIVGIVTSACHKIFTAVIVIPAILSDVDPWVTALCAAYEALSLNANFLLFFIQQLSWTSATSCPSAQCLREPSSAALRRSPVTEASWPVRLETTPPSSPTTLRPRSPESSSPLVPRRSSPLPTGQLLVRMFACFCYQWLAIIFNKLGYHSVVELTADHLLIVCGRCCRWWWSYWQAHPEGRSCLPQIQGQEELLASCPWCGHERK